MAVVGQPAGVSDEATFSRYQLQRRRAERLFACYSFHSLNKRGRLTVHLEQNERQNRSLCFSAITTSLLRQQPGAALNRFVTSSSAESLFGSC